MVLEGPGGAFVPALKIAELIRTYHWRTKVDADAICTSSCAFIWLAGASRKATSSSIIGFHRVYLTNQARTRTAEDVAGNAYLGRYLGSLGLDYEAVGFIIQSGPEQMTFLTEEAAVRLKISIEGGLPSERTVDRIWQFNEPEYDHLQHANPILPSKKNVAVVTEDLMLRAAPDPQARNVLAGVDPDHLPVGAEFTFPAGRNTPCVMHTNGGHWCKLSVQINGKEYRGWARSWYLMLRSGNRVGCEWGRDRFCNG